MSVSLSGLAWLITQLRISSCVEIGRRSLQSLAIANVETVKGKGRMILPHQRIAAGIEGINAKIRGIFSQYLFADELARPFLPPGQGGMTTGEIVRQKSDGVAVGGGYDFHHDLVQVRIEEPGTEDFFSMLSCQR